MKLLLSLFFIIFQAQALQLMEFRSEALYAAKVYFSDKTMITLGLDLKNSELKNFRFSEEAIITDSHRSEILAYKTNNPNLSGKAEAVLDFIYYFPTTPVKNLKDQIVQSRAYTNICSYRLMDLWTQYDIRGKIYTELILVGDEATKCMGMCGKDCKRKKRKEIYTQECLNHDLCHRRTKSFFGCFDELIAAAHGHFFGDECQ